MSDVKPKHPMEVIKDLPYSIEYKGGRENALPELLTYIHTLEESVRHYFSEANIEIEKDMAYEQAKNFAVIAVTDDALRTYIKTAFETGWRSALERMKR